MNFHDQVIRNRSYRRFDESHALSESTLRELVDLARVTPSAMNAQPLRYVISCDPTTNARIFETLSWAGALANWGGPEPGERPTGYIVVLMDKSDNPNPGQDVGIASQTILLSAVEQGLGGCMIASVKRKDLGAAVGVPEGLAISLVIALGKPIEEVSLEEAAPGASLRYYREDDGSHHVPKRRLDDIIVKSFG